MSAKEPTTTITTVTITTTTARRPRRHAEPPEVADRTGHAELRLLALAAASSRARASCSSTAAATSSPSRAADDGHARSAVQRRNFFQLMGASMALAGVGGPAGATRRKRSSRWRAAPRTRSRARRSSTRRRSTSAASATRCVATSFEGRPIHLDGNPDHPFAGWRGPRGHEAPRRASTVRAGARSSTSTIRIARRTR